MVMISADMAESSLNAGMEKGNRKSTNPAERGALKQRVFQLSPVVGSESAFGSPVFPEKRADEIGYLLR